MLLQGTWQRRKARVNLAYTIGWYQGDFDTGGLPNYAYTFLFNRQRTSGDERHRAVLSAMLPFRSASCSRRRHDSPARGRSSPSTVATSTSTTSPATTTGGTVTTTGNRTVIRSKSWNNWYRTVDIRLARALFTVNKTKVGFSAEVFNVFNFNNNLSYGGTQFTVYRRCQSPRSASTAAYRRGRDRWG